MKMNDKAVENIMKAFSDVTIEPTLGELYIVAESFGRVDLKTIRELGFEVQSIYQKNGKVVIYLDEQNK
jgi:uncharacterized protein YlzI (FlbEa/FlbD family)